MRAEIISIGTELLLGSILNTNARFLSQKCAENAIDVFHQTTVGDNIERVAQSFRAAAGRADIIIASGGLGPTEDDVTVRGLSRFLGRPLVFHKPTYNCVERWLKVRGRPMTPLVARQCFVPQGAFTLQNKKGTAPGILCHTRFQNTDKWILLLPGPPRELEPMFIEDALPLLKREAKIKKECFFTRAVKIAELIEVEVAAKVKDLLKLKPPLTVGIYARPGEVELKIMAKAASVSKARVMALRLEKEIRRRFKDKVYGIDQETLSSAVGALLRKNKKTLGAAESCTGGLFSNLITDAPGCSDYFLGGIIAYGNRIKNSILGVDEALLKKHGAVSEVAAKKMAQNVREILKTNYGIALTGIAGPGGGSSKKPVGLVYIALADGRKTTCCKNQFFGTRVEIKNRAAHKALDLLRLRLLTLNSQKPHARLKK